VKGNLLFFKFNSWRRFIKFVVFCDYFIAHIEKPEFRAPHMQM